MPILQWNVFLKYDIEREVYLSLGKQNIILGSWRMVRIVLKTLKQHFLGSLLNKNPPANTREASSTPGPGGFHMPGATKPMHNNR